MPKSTALQPLHFFTLLDQVAFLICVRACNRFTLSVLDGRNRVRMDRFRLRVREKGATPLVRFKPFRT